MNATSIISHRMFVAALSHEENGAAKSKPANGASAASKDKRARPVRGQESVTNADGRQLFFAAITEGLQSAEA